MSNNSQSGGYIHPTSSTGLPGNLTFTQFIQSLIVGVSGIDGTLVRPKWQQKPPQQPNECTTWLAFGIASGNQDTNAYETQNPDGSYEFQRNEEFEIQVTIYGPDSFELSETIRDNLQLTQNLDALSLGNVKLINTGRVMHAPELINEQFFDRYDFSIFLRRQRIRSYPIVNFTSASGVIRAPTAVNDNYSIDYKTN